jgi:hypothetical protein
MYDEELKKSDYNWRVKLIPFLEKDRKCWSAEELSKRADYNGIHLPLEKFDDLLKRDIFNHPKIAICFEDAPGHFEEIVDGDAKPGKRFLRYKPKVPNVKNKEDFKKKLEADTLEGGALWDNLQEGLDDAYSNIKTDLQDMVRAGLVMSMDNKDTKQTILFAACSYNFEFFQKDPPVDDGLKQKWIESRSALPKSMVDIEQQTKNVIRTTEEGGRRKVKIVFFYLFIYRFIYYYYRHCCCC